MNRTRHERSRHLADDGAALVEFALILPIFALMLFGMIQFGLLFAGWAQLRNAVQTSARMESVGEVAPQCGDYSPAACTVAVLIGAPTGLTSPSGVVTSVSTNGAACQMTGTNNDVLSCNNASWLDGYYVYLNGRWQQIVNAAPSSASQVTDKDALGDGASTWQCDSTCTNIATRVNGTANLALGSDYDNVAVSANGGGQVVVCAHLPVTPFTGLLPKMSVSTESTFYIETGNAGTMNQGGIPCG
jgi:Flp pilus assembly pilin Flp